MTDTTKYPKPQGLGKDALHDAQWDLIDHGATTLAGNEDPDRWIYWLTRYAPFAPDELEIRSHNAHALIIGLKE